MTKTCHIRRLVLRKKRLEGEFCLGRQLAYRSTLLATLSFLICTLPCFPPAALTGLAFSPRDDSGYSHVRFAVLKSLVDDVSSIDAKVATKIWADTIGVSRNLWKTATVEISEDATSVLEGVKEGRLDIACVPTVDYLRLKPQLNVVPCLTYEQAGELGVSYLLVVPQSEEIQSLADLRDKRIAVTVKGSQHSQSELWLSVILEHTGTFELDEFFSQVRRVRKPSQAILPAFFGQVQAAVVARSAFETAIELNPQIGQRLTILAESPRFVPIVVLMSRPMWNQAWDKYVGHLDEIIKDPKSLQTFTIYRISRLVRWKPEFAKSTEELLRRRRELGAKGRISLRSRGAN
jgi:ABC-type phosphate/phosphonate transport system substrate-binding protein